MTAPEPEPAWDDPAWLALPTVGVPCPDCGAWARMMWPRTIVIRHRDDCEIAAADLRRLGNGHERR